MHQVKRFVDVFQAHGVGHHVINFDLTFHVFIHVAGQFGTTTYTAECRAAPDTTGYQLEGAGTDFLASAGNTDDDRFAPALVAAFQRGTHQVYVANAFK